jgi:hypothetical protein
VIQKAGEDIGVHRARGDSRRDGRNDLAGNGVIGLVVQIQAGIKGGGNGRMLSKSRACLGLSRCEDLGRVGAVEHHDSQIGPAAVGEIDGKNGHALKLRPTRREDKTESAAIGTAVDLNELKCRIGTQPPIKVERKELKLGSLA